MNVFAALKLIQFDHLPMNHAQVVVTDDTGKPNSALTDLLSDCLNKIDIFVNLASAATVSDIIDDLHLLTPLPYDVLEEYQKILEQPITAVNFASHKQLVELVYQPYE